MSNNIFLTSNDERKDIEKVLSKWGEVRLKRVFIIEG